MADPAVALNVRPPRSRIYRAARRIARRMEPAIAQVFLGAVHDLLSQIDDAALRDAVVGGNVDVILSAVATGGDIRELMLVARLENLLLRVSQATGFANQQILNRALGLTWRFNAIHPDVVLAASRQAGLLVVAVADDVREAVRSIVTIGQSAGLTPAQQAQAIRNVVGLPPNWANAPYNLGVELRAGTFTASRRLSAADKARIRSRLAKGTADEAFIRQMQERYAESLRNRRALNIARHESLTAAHTGQRQAWRQAQGDRVLPQSSRRIWIVTDDDRLRDTHRAVPGMNPGGVRLDEPYQTPLGPSEGPPLEILCRCGEGLIFPGRRGVL